MMNRTLGNWFLIASIGVAGSAHALPTLQLGIAGGVYDNATETIIAPGDAFTLYAFLTADSKNPITDTYAVSMAVKPKVSSPSALGSFTVGGNGVDVTADMIFGVPPLDLVLPADDPGDLADHGIFDTYFFEQQFQFAATDQSAPFNTQDNPSSGPQAGSGMYFHAFTIDVANLTDGYSIHFDLYNMETVSCGQKKNCTPGDIDQSQFAPFSHDAETKTSRDPKNPPSEIPEPGTLLLVGLALTGFGLVRRRKF